MAPVIPASQERVPAVFKAALATRWCIKSANGDASVSEARRSSGEQPWFAVMNNHSLASYYRLLFRYSADISQIDGTDSAGDGAPCASPASLSWMLHAQVRPHRCSGHRARLAGDGRRFRWDVVGSTRDRKRHV
ncbi:protein of unknown function [Methylorubrum extorquens]|uniref:Uncharacterized protein n=1 Tax=Methylorubrum extorquens TaxID=408 RepID=A0A2N9AVA1_METEX|nr:protein of unknown function [Methylorubrum extorquens]